MLIRGGEGGLSKEGVQRCPRRKNMGVLVLVRSELTFCLDTLDDNFAHGGSLYT